MGPLVDASFDQLLLRPYKSSTTYANLRRTGQGVLHVTDDVNLIAQAAIGQFRRAPELVPAEGVEGFILANTCRWFAFRVVAIDDSAQPAEMRAVVVKRGRRRDFFGFNRVTSSSRATPVILSLCSATYGAKNLCLVIELPSVATVSWLSVRAITSGLL